MNWNPNFPTSHPHAMTNPLLSPPHLSDLNCPQKEIYFDQLQQLNPESKASSLVNKKIKLFNNSTNTFLPFHTKHPKTQHCERFFNLLENFKPTNFNSKEIAETFLDLISNELIKTNWRSSCLILSDIFCQNLTEENWACFCLFLNEFYQLDAEDFENNETYDFISTFQQKIQDRIKIEFERKPVFSLEHPLFCSRTCLMIFNFLKRWDTDLTDYQQVLSVETAEKSSHVFTVSYQQPIDQITEQLKTLIQQLNKEQKIFYRQSLDWEEECFAYCRYPDILPYRHNNLQHVLGYFFNASPIKDHLQQCRWILTQGPQTETIGDFFQAIWTTEAQVVVMLTTCQEYDQNTGKILEKCMQYWPKNLTSLDVISENCNTHFQISLINEQSISLGKKRILNIKTKESERQIQQIHIDQWLDNNTLESKYLHQLVDSIYQLEKSNQKPIFIHCSAGVGRSGVLTACLIIKKILPSLLEKTRDQNKNLHPENLKLNLEKLLIALRQQRVSMIVNTKQLIAIKDYFDQEIKNIIE